jgi:hypothetical protein
MQLRDKPVILHCTALSPCGNTLPLTENEQSFSYVGVNRRFGWFVEHTWGTASWNGEAFCPDHEDEAMELLRSED